MADPQSVEADNDFSNRRMTRSAFKRAFGYPEKYPERKKLRSKQKPGGLSKTDDNQQQQHMEGKDGTEVRKSLTGKALREQLRERRKRWRKLTTEEAERYSKKVMESEGFDVVDLPDYIENCCLIKPVKNLSEEQGVIEKCSKSAIATFNKQHRTKYRFVELIRANYKLGSSIYYYITFVAEDKDAGTNNFQALVGSLFKRATVKFCRLEKPPNVMDDLSSSFRHHKYFDSLTLSIKFEVQFITLSPLMLMNGCMMNGHLAGSACNIDGCVGRPFSEYYPEMCPTPKSQVSYFST